MSRCTVDDWASPVPDRKEAEARRVLDGPYPQVPADLAARAADQGRRMQHRRRYTRNALIAVTVLALVALAVFATLTWPWGAAEGGPPATPPPLH